MAGHATYATTFTIFGSDLSTCLGAYCMAFDEMEWPITQVRSGNEITGYIPFEPGADKLADVTVKRMDNQNFKVTLTAAGEGISEEQLEKFAALLDKMRGEIMDKSLQMELQAAYKRRLHKANIETLKKDKAGVFYFLKDVFFTPHPAQVVGFLMLINVGVFIAMCIAGVGFFDTDVAKAVNWGAAAKYKVVEGEYWRLFTACFIHFGIGHIAANMIGLLYASIFLMLVLNRWQFLLGYVVTGVISMAVSIWWHGDTITAGASGAIFGCYGMLLGLALTRLFSSSDRSVIFIYLAVYVGINLLYGLKDGVDAAAHLGGLLSGLVIGLLYYFPLQYQKKHLFILTDAVVLVFGIVTTTVLMSMTTYYGTEMMAMESRYNMYEHDALEYYRVPDTTADVELQLLDKGIVQFDKAIIVADSMRQIEGAPKEIVLYTQRLKLYGQYRKYEMELRRKGYAQQSAEWNDSVKIVAAQVDSLLRIFKEE